MLSGRLNSTQIGFLKIPELVRVPSCFQYRNQGIHLDSASPGQQHQRSGQEGLGIQARSLLVPGAGYGLSYTQMDPLPLSELVVQIVDLKPSFLGWEQACERHKASRLRVIPGSADHNLSSSYSVTEGASLDISTHRFPVDSM